ncbi:GGDEF domain-containing protein [Vibrio sp. RE86]|uniref:sensor domain-containing diguanylate cyclase n=1 Tax=Vibrio sp. RE86 TaxID=2607605 RepID=UPI001493ACB1|nr:GGDEF domain-containing protein [Vibrio sp. RE86]NOH78875.1 GGDEF domain-containing protein [Vibrio sp. RE86]
MIELERIEDIYNQDHFTLHEAVLNELGSFVFVKNRKGEYLYANQLTLELFNTTLEDLIGKTDYDFFEAELIHDILESDNTVYSTGGSVVNEERTKAIPDGKVRIYRAIKKPIISSLTNQVIGLIGVSTDITDMVSMRDKLAVQASTDELTKLCNRRKLWEYFLDAYRHSQKMHQPLACILIDIDNFKSINDNYGHDFGDRVIVELADIIRANMRPTDCCGRVGGEEFLVVLNNTTTRAAFDIAERFRIAFQSLSFKEVAPSFSISCGVTERLEKDCDFMDMYRRVDQALYDAKGQGRNQSAIQ